MAILFYRAEDAYGCFSNFSRHPVTIYGRTWKTSEHAFQAMKFHHSPEHVESVANALTAGQAAKLGRNRSYPMRSDWDQPPVWEDRFKKPQPDDKLDRRVILTEDLFARVKDVVMYEVCKAKFEQHEDIRRVLLETHPYALIEDTTDDAYWGWGASKIGQNKLGRLLMLIRGELR
jgi:predicted NAD-dependent protein-ADP-ribosyltransferase YbiA (DUF1768 family)